jgi:hypothetical protein
VTACKFKNQPRLERVLDLRSFLGAISSVDRSDISENVRVGSTVRTEPQLNDDAANQIIDRLLNHDFVTHEGVTDVVLSVESMRAFAHIANHAYHCRARHALAGSSTNCKLAGRIAVLPVRTDPTTDQSLAALEINDAESGTQNKQSALTSKSRVSRSRRHSKRSRGFEGQCPCCRQKFAEAKLLNADQLPKDGLCRFVMGRERSHSRSRSLANAPFVINWTKILTAAGCGRWIILLRRRSG